MRWILILLTIFFATLQYRLWIGAGSWEQIVSLQRQMESQKLINERLQDRNRVLENEVRDLKSGMESVEQRARRELGMIKQGETFYLLVKEEKQPRNE